MLPALTNLHTLVLKDFGMPEDLLALLYTSVGSRLKRLDLHFMAMVADSPGINLADLARCCLKLEELTVCDTAVSWGTTAGAMVKNNQQPFLHLKVCRLLRVTYSDESDWEWVPRLASQLRVLHLEASAGMTDDSLEAIVFESQKLSFLEEFFVVGSSNKLTTKSVLLLADVCPKLRWMGDLRDWRICSAADRKAMRAIQRHGWDTTMHEPKKTRQEDKKVVFDTGQIVDGIMRDCSLE